MRDKKELNQRLGLGFVLVLAGFTIANFLHKDVKFSDTENRMLQQKPDFSLTELVDGRFMSSFEKYQTDQFAFRDSWIRLQTAADRLLGKNKSGDVYLGEQQLFEQTSEISEDVWKNLDAINSFCSQYPDAHSYLMLAPDAASVQQERLPKYAPVADQKRQLQELLQ